MESWGRDEWVEGKREGEREEEGGEGGKGREIERGNGRDLRLDLELVDFQSKKFVGAFFLFFLESQWKPLLSRINSRQELGRFL